MKIYYVNFSPFIFQNLSRKDERALEAVFEKFKDLYNLFLILDNENWFRLFYEFINDLDEDLKKDLELYIEYLDKNNKLIFDKCSYKEEKEIFKCFDFVDHYIATQSNPEKILLLREC